MVSSEAYIGVTVNKLLNCVKSVYDRQSVTEIPSVRVEKVQKTFHLVSMFKVSRSVTPQRTRICH